MFEVEILNPWTAAAYAPLSTSVFAKILQEVGPGGIGLGVGARVGGRPVGVAVGEIVDDAFALRWIFVQSESRNQGIARALLSALEAKLPERGVNAVYTSHPTSLPDRDAVEGMFRTAGWTGRPAIQMSCIIESLLKARWVTSTRTPQGFRTFLWADSPAASEDWHKSWVPRNLSPSRFRALEPNTSLGVSWNGDTVAWYLTSAAGHGIVCCEALCVRPDARPRGVTRLVIAESLRRQNAALGPSSRVLFSVARQNDLMMAVLARHLRTHAVEENEIVLRSKILTADHQVAGAVH